MFASFKIDYIQKPSLSLKSAFSVSLLVCEFNPPRQTWCQKFIGTYPSLTDSKHNKPFLHKKYFPYQEHQMHTCMQYQ